VTTIITDVAVFDGLGLSGPRTIVIKHGRITDEDPCAGDEPYESVNGSGYTLLPGFIDSHFHPDTVAHLKEAARYGITTGVVMACPEPLLCASLQGHVGLPRLVLASTPGAAVNSIHGRMLGLNESTALGNNSIEWVDKQVASGADLIKLIAETPGLDQATLSAATAAAHAQGRSVACHATDYKSVQQALLAGVDHVHHVPLDRALDGSAIARFNAISVPTLIMMRKTSEAIPALNFNASIASARALHEAGITILAGTDSNAQNLAPGHPAFGQSMHDELELLVEAGLEPLQALRSATKLPVDVWGLYDRGRTESGMVADLVLVEGNPLTNISVTREIRKVWVGGHLFDG
jgi:imidazolonepropionase-like amidohydrolase